MPLDSCQFIWSSWCATSRSWASIWMQWHDSVPGCCRWSGPAADVSAQHAQLLYQLADIDKQTAATIALVLQPVLTISTLLMISRIVLSWYPQVRCARW